jgi:hypothetical protein
MDEVVVGWGEVVCVLMVGGLERMNQSAWYRSIDVLGKRWMKNSNKHCFFLFMSLTLSPPPSNQHLLLLITISANVLQSKPIG